jgi:hypothetical protein
MTHETVQAQISTPAEKPAAPTKAVQPSQGRADKKKAIIELTDVELQAVSGGGSKPGIASGSN